MMTDWPAILRDYGPLVWRTLQRLLNHDSDASDCFQRTFLAAVELSRKEVIRNWPAVLRRLATSRALEILRTRYRHRRESLPDEIADSKRYDPLDDIGYGELAERLRSALAEIDPTLANVFCLIGLEGMSNLEAASELGVTANHIGVLLHRARNALREKLPEFDPATTVRENP